MQNFRTLVRTPTDRFLYLKLLSSALKDCFAIAIRARTSLWHLASLVFHDPKYLNFNLIPSTLILHIGMLCDFNMTMHSVFFVFITIP